MGAERRRPDWTPPVKPRHSSGRGSGGQPGSRRRHRPRGGAARGDSGPQGESCGSGRRPLLPARPNAWALGITPASAQACTLEMQLKRHAMQAQASACWRPPPRVPKRCGCPSWPACRPHVTSTPTKATGWLIHGRIALLLAAPENGGITGDPTDSRPSGSLPHWQLRKPASMPAPSPVRSLRHRQLRNSGTPTFQGTAAACHRRRWFSRQASGSARPGWPSNCQIRAPCSAVFQDRMPRRA